MGADIDLAVTALVRPIAIVIVVVGRSSRRAGVLRRTIICENGIDSAPCPSSEAIRRRLGAMRAGFVMTAATAVAPWEGTALRCGEGQYEGWHRTSVCAGGNEA